MIGTILLGIDLYLAIVTSIWIVLSIVADVITSSNTASWGEDLLKRLQVNSGMRFVLMLLTSLFWTIFIMA